MFVVYDLEYFDIGLPMLEYFDIAYKITSILAKTLGLHRFFANCLRFESTS